MASRLPAFQFYPGDWLKDPAVRSLSPAARGLWIDLLCLMSESDQRGYLELNGQPVSFEQISRMTGVQNTKVDRLLSELEKSGVFSKDERGVIYSRRMVTDERKRHLCAEAGRRGGNPTLKPTLKPTLADDGKGHAKPNPTPSSSSSSSSSDNTPLPPSPAAKPASKGGVADGPVPPPDEDERKRARQGLREYLAQHSRGRLGDPPPQTVGKLLQAAGGETEASYTRIRDALIDLSGRTSSQPSGWGWYLAVVPPMLGQPPEEAIA